MTRERRLLSAIKASAARVAEACKERDDQEMFETLGECLVWVIALDDLLEDRTGYKSRRNSDSKGGHFLQGLRYARIAAVHGETVVDVADPVAVPYGPGLIRHNRGGSRFLGPPTVMRWTFQQALPDPDPPAPNLKRAHNDLAGMEVTLPIAAGLDWLDRAAATFPP